MKQRILYCGHIYVADTDMIGLQKSIDPFFEEDHIPSGQLGEIRTICRYCGKIMSTVVVKVDRNNERQFRYNPAAGRYAPKYVTDVYGDCGCASS
jgi:hypothetical protein